MGLLFLFVISKQPKNTVLIMVVLVTSDQQVLFYPLNARCHTGKQQVLIFQSLTGHDWGSNLEPS